MEVLHTESIRLELIQLPDEGDAFPSLVIRRYLERYSLTQHNDEEYHKRPLIIADEVSSNNIDREASCNLMCDVCIQPINTVSPFYRCLDCYFLAHVACADHLCRVKFPFAEYYSDILCPDPKNLVFNSIFPRLYCRRPCNGLCYYGDDETVGLFFTDCECMAVRALNTITHASHKQHVLYQSTIGPCTSSLSCCSGVSFAFNVYSLFCNFHIHIRCALLPKRTQHNEFDEHPLELITQTHHHQSIEEHYGCCFCEVCEKDIDHMYWYYGCHKCDNYFHINCIPSVGHLPKVKFGKTLVDNNIHPHHPLTLTRMLTHDTDERCGYCNQIIKGFVDEMAFHCLDCDFWIHFLCAWAATNKTSRPPLAVYMDIEKMNERGIKEIVPLEE